MAEGFVRVASLGEVEPGQLLAVEAAGRRICLANVDGEIYAFRDNCTHKDFPLSTGHLEDGTVECSWHGARFDVRTGRALSLPAIKPLKLIETKVEDGGIYLAL